MIEARRVSKMYGRGVYALHDLSLRVDKFEFVFLAGPSGAGKSTLLRLLLRQDVPSEGEMVVGGRNLAQLTPGQVQSSRRSLGFVFQTSSCCSGKRCWRTSPSCRACSAWS
jgi:cell division transport system ATP-binding protein